jgi:NAD(P)-dependent dehydrogenase (short-subunit alcohol dehydrogenase family)
MERTLFVTGADGGLGVGFVKKFIAEGWRVFAGRFAPGSALDSFAAASGGRCTPVPLDVRSVESASEAARLVAESCTGVDLLINNAGINPDKEITLEKLDIELSRQAIDVNALGPLRVTQQFLPLLRKGSLKRIANISSEAGSITNCYRTTWFGYSMSKAGLNIQTRILQNYLGPEGFTVVAVHPGWMRSGMGAANATYAPEQSAESLYPILTGPRAAGAPQYFQWDGTQLPW